MAGVIATDDALNLPPAQVVKELTARESYLAHEELVQFVGAGQFFGFSSASSSSVAGSSDCCCSTTGTLKNSPANSITTV